ncbi:ubiquinone/menaquinone biosynthesis C-methylase UbiE [Mycolicibacterium iranicum]|uniref:Ubiquinone/menaquinone biosynthesis C-methylase UbiE n=1 Tax=Mycolicibacterium iranicum TaxID=912594 RepID=A0A839Q6V8_MYCIR|nr:class I SAM-dependent methyltransferase [Mycolicibacterium iranicum]MBB2990105.1 ubiquinone/menaquinone biosynthesis C-methylase UbiE [Mycolicibacterium iranicum]
MSETSPLAVNHHADHPGFSGVTGAVFALIFLLTGRASAAFAADLMRVGHDDHVVDIGCGPGTAARAAAHRRAAVTGVDPSASMLRLARLATRRNAAISWREGTAESLPVAEDSATLVWALATVHHWRDVDAGLREAHRVLRPGGRLLAVERRTEPGANGVASHGWTAEQAEAFAALCRRAGFADVAVGTGHAGRRDVWAVTARTPE